MCIIILKLSSYIYSSAIKWVYKCTFSAKQSSMSFFVLFEQRMLWRDCVDVSASISDMDVKQINYFALGFMGTY